jgi:hypothetical protein
MAPPRDERHQRKVDHLLATERHCCRAAFDVDVTIYHGVDTILRCDRNVSNLHVAKFQVIPHGGGNTPAKVNGVTHRFAVLLIRQRTRIGSVTDSELAPVHYPVERSLRH